MTDYTDAMRALNDAVYAAVKAANNEDGAPVEALRLMARDVDSLIDHGVTYAELQQMIALYQGTNMAGLV